MSFFRFLVGLLIAAGVAFGLYKLTLEKGLGGDTTLGKQSGELSGETVAVRAPIEEPEDAAADSTGDAPADEAQTFVERTEAAIKPADGDSNDDAAVTDAEPELSITRSEPDAEPVAETQPAPTPAADPDTTTTTDTGSTDVLSAITGGMAYAEAREAMVGAGWQPRSLDAASRTADIKDSEQALLDTGYDELEGCNDAARPICRFEFIDGGDRIAAVITAGADSDPSVIDAFLMDVSAN